MSGKSIAIIALILGVLAVVTGSYLAGWITLWLVKQSSVLTALTYFEFWSAFGVAEWAPYPLEIKLGGRLGIGPPVLAWLVLLIPLLKAKPESLHGEASFADLADLKKSGLPKQTKQSIRIGKYKNHLLWLNGALHLIVICPTRSGKTINIAIPVLLTYAQSMAVSNRKGELRKLTCGQRLAMGQHVDVWAPYDVGGRTHRFNPFTLPAGLEQGVRIGEIQTIAAILYPDEPGKGVFWTSQSRAAFMAFASFLFDAWEPLWRKGLPSDPKTVESFPSLEPILRFSAGGSGQTTMQMLQSMLCCIVQTRAQLRSVSGDNGAQNFITNHGCQVAFAPREQSDATEYREMLGYKTLRRKQESRSRGGGSNQTSTSYNEERRAMLLPQEVKELPQDDELIFLEGTMSIKASKNWFFKDKQLKKLTELAPVVMEPVAKRLAVASAPLATEGRREIRPQNELAAIWLQ